MKTSVEYSKVRKRKPNIYCLPTPVGSKVYLGFQRIYTAENLKKNRSPLHLKYIFDKLRIAKRFVVTFSIR